MLIDIIQDPRFEIMQVTFIGGADGVTGSCTLLTDDRIGVRALVDCGAYAERPAGIPDGAPRLPFDARLLDFVVLTHAHRDHCGRLPQLHRAGFRGPVYCTDATAWMTRLALLDAAKFSREYDASDVEMIDFHTVDRWPDFSFDIPLRLHGLAITFHRSAHILGAVSATIGWRSRVGVARAITFSGDIGGNTPDNPYQSLLAGQSLPPSVDYMVVESTRGAEPARGPEYKSFDARIQAWADLLVDSDARGGGPVIAPCFAIHRAQELWFDLDTVLRVTGAGSPDAFGRPRWLSLDAPLAARMTEVYAAALADRLGPAGAPAYRNPDMAARLGLADEAAVDDYLGALWRRVADNKAPGGTLRAMQDETLSRVIALAGSGMCEGGRIVDFIADQITNPAATIVLCGYAPPTTGAGRLRAYLGGEWPEGMALPLGNVRLDTSRIRARIVDFGDYYSGHGDLDALQRFVFDPAGPEAGPRVPATVFLNHGEAESRIALARTLRTRADANAPDDRTLARVILPTGGQRFDLDSPDQRRENMAPRRRRLSG